MEFTAASPAQSAALTRRVTMLSVAIAAVLVVLKAGAWMASGSVALLASLADSGLDLIASSVTFFAVRYAATPPDAEHRYGHGKAEAFASLIQAGLVFAAAVVIGQQAIGHLIRPQPMAKEGWAIVVMIVSIVLTGLLIFAQTRTLRLTTSVAVSGDRLHYAADFASNAVALIAIAATSVLGWAGFDALGGLAVGAVLLWGAVKVFREAADQLMDKELPEAARRRIVDLMTKDGKIIDVHQLRTRASGPTIHIQMHADLDPDLSLEAAHQAVVAAENRVLEAFPAADILIHPDPRGRAAPHGGAFAESHEGQPGAK